MNRLPSKVAGLRMRIERPAAIWIKPGESKVYFLLNPEELPKTFRTAIGVIDRTLAVLDPQA